MDLNISALGLYVVTVVAMIAVPGPVVLLVTGAGLAGGPYHALRTIFGTNVASLVLIVISGLIVNGLLSMNATVFVVIKLLGSLYIAYVALQILREPPPATDATVFTARAGGFTNGFVMGISNPKDIIFFASFFPQFINVTSNTNVSLLLLTAVWIVLDFATLMLVYTFIRKLARPSTHYKLMKIAAYLLLLIAMIGGASSLLAFDA